VFAGPGTGGAGTPTFRTLIAADIPALSYVTSVDGSGGTTGLTLSGGPITTSGTLTLGGTLIAANGGTGQSSYTAGDLLYASGATALSKLAAGTATQVLHGGTTPSWSAVSLTADVSGTLPIASGGTGQTTANAAFGALSPMTANGDLITRVGGAPAALAAGANGQILSIVAGAPTWTSASSESVSFTNSQGGPITVGNVVYVKADGTVALAQATTASVSTAIGLVQDASIANTSAGYVTLDGVVSGLTGLTPGVTYYLSAVSAGVLTATAPTTAGQYVCEIGVAISATAIKVNIAPTILL